MKSQYLGRTARPGRSRNNNTVTLPAPVNGLVTSESVLGTIQASAQVLDNWFPTRRGISMRRGSRTEASISIEGDPVRSLIVYNARSQKKLFAASDTEIFDVTSVADPVVPPAASVSDQTSGYYSFVNFATSGGQYLTVVNGTDPLLLYNPTDGWVQITDSSTPAITGGETQDLQQVWVYRNRQFFVKGASLIVHYLPSGAVAGALGTIDMNGVFQKGGAIVLGATWSIDAGNGLDDKCVIITDQGEAAIYQGSNPADANDWVLVGVYDVGAPMGRRATMKNGGDLVVGTRAGMVPISAAIEKDPEETSVAALSRNIEPDWLRHASERSALPWEIVKDANGGYCIASMPVTAAGQQRIAYVMNLETGKWCRYTNLDIQCLAYHNGNLYFGTSDGRVKIANIGGNDDGAPIYYTCVGNPEMLDGAAIYKTILQFKATFISSTPFLPQLSASMDYKVLLPAAPNSSDDVSSDAWDSGVWEVALWDAAAPDPSYSSEIASIGASGYVMQYQLQVTGALTPAPHTDFVTLDVSYETGRPSL